MEGKALLVICACSEGNHTVWGFLKAYGVRVILVDEHDNNHGINEVDKLYQYDFSNHSQDESHTEKIVKLLASEHIDGCFTFKTSCVPLTAMICEKLKLPGGNVAAAKLINNKYDYLHHLYSSSATKPYSCDVIRIENVEDIQGIPEDFTFPAVLKPVHGCGSACVKRVENKEEAERQYVRIQEEHIAKPRNTYGFNNDMILTEFIEGSKHEVDVVVSNGVQIACVIADYAPSITERFLYTCYRLPSQLPANQQVAIVKAIEEIRTSIGISDGNLNFEFRTTNAGLKLIEVNGRMGMPHRKENIRKCYDIDLLKCTVQACLGITTCTLPISLTPKTQVVAVLCYGSLHGVQLKSEQVQQYLKDLETKENFRVIPYERSFPYVPIIAQFEQPTCCICFYDNDIENAKSRLLTMFEDCGLDSIGYNIRELLGAI